MRRDKFTNALVNKNAVYQVSGIIFSLAEKRNQKGFLPASESLQSALVGL